MAFSQTHLKIQWMLFVDHLYVTICLSVVELLHPYQTPHDEGRHRWHSSTLNKMFCILQSKNLKTFNNHLCVLYHLQVTHINLLLKTWKPCSFNTSFQVTLSWLLTSSTSSLLQNGLERRVVEKFNPLSSLIVFELVRSGMEK